MSACGLRLLGLAYGGPTSLDGTWVVAYDPTRPGFGPAGEPMTAHVEVLDEGEAAA